MSLPDPLVTTIMLDDVPYQVSTDFMPPETELAWINRHVREVFDFIELHAMPSSLYEEVNAIEIVPEENETVQSVCARYRTALANV